MESNQDIDEKAKTKRKLASVQEISSVSPHPKVDKVELAKVLGWQVIVPKGKFKANDKVVYFEIDSLLPDCEWSQPMKRNHFKVATTKMKGQLSQGEIFPLNILKSVDEAFNPDNYAIGTDLTEKLHIDKYEKDADLKTVKIPDIKNGDKKFPDGKIERTDEPRIQSNQEYIDLFKGKPYYMTLKYDGVSGTYLFIDDEFYICSRNVRLPFQKDNAYSKVVTKYGLYEQLIKQNKRYAIQGEVYGPGIIKNFLGVKEVCFAVFTMKDLVDNRYLDMQELIDKCKEMDLPMVKILETGDSFNYTEEQLKEMAKGTYEGTNNPREGIVFRLQKDWFIDEEHRMSFKYVNDDFLLINAQMAEQERKEKEEKAAKAKKK